MVDAAITDGSALLTTLFHAFKAAGVWPGPEHVNPLDSSAPFYVTYRCADGKWISIGALEPQFYALLVEKSGLTALAAGGQIRVPQGAQAAPANSIRRTS